MPSSSHNHKLIILTGINGAGKDTLAPRLAAWLSRRTGQPARAVYAPTITPAAGQFRTAVLEGRPRSPLAEMLGYYAGHAEAAQELLKLRREQHLVVNRGPETTLVYNALAHQLPAAELELAHQLYDTILGQLQPTLTILLDVSLTVSRQRSAQQAETDHIQDRDDVYYHNLIQGYHQLAERYPRWAIVDANPTPNQVLTDIQAHVSSAIMDT